MKIFGKCVSCVNGRRQLLTLFTIKLSVCSLTGLYKKKLISTDTFFDKILKKKTFAKQYKN